MLVSGVWGAARLEKGLPLTFSALLRVKRPSTIVMISSDEETLVVQFLVSLAMDLERY
jgi:hypothetical protein